MILLDTHVLIWFASDDRRLGSRTVAAVDRALQRGDVAIASFSFWEVGMLVAKKKLVVSPEALRSRALLQGLEELTLDGVIAIASAGLPRFHGDPADRIIVATALAYGATLMTADEAILKWKGAGLKVHDARA